MGDLFRARTIIATICAAVACSDCASSSDPPNDSRPEVVIGVDLPLAGRDAGDGVAALDAVKLAATENNRSASSFRVTLAVRDTARGGYRDPHADEAIDPIYDAKHGADDAREFASDQRVLAVLGPFESTVARAEAPIARRARLALITASARASDLTDRQSGDAVLFRTYPPDQADGYACARSAAAFGFRRVFVVDDGEPHGRSIADAFVRDFQGRSRAIAGRATLNGSLGPLLGNIRASRADAVIFGGPSPTNALFMRPALARAVLDVHRVALMGSQGFMPPAFADGVWYGTNVEYYTIWPASLPTSEEALRFADAFRASYGEAPTSAASYYYAAATLVLRAIQDAASDCACRPSRARVLSRLRSTRDVPTVMGRLTLLPNGDESPWRMALVSIRRGRYAFGREIDVWPTLRVHDTYKSPRDGGNSTQPSPWGRARSD